MAGIEPALALTRARGRRHGQPRRPAQSVGRRPSEATAIFDGVVAWNRLVHDAVYAELAARPIAGVDGRRPLPRHRLDQRRGAPLQRGSNASCACSGSTRTPTSIRNRLTPSGNSARHAGRLPLWSWAGRTRPYEWARSPPSHRSGSARSASEAWTRAKSASSMRWSSKSSTCATSTKWGCAIRWRSRLATLDANTHLHVSFDVDFLDAEVALRAWAPPYAAARPIAKRNCAWK